jgi:hypothetical protein
LPPARPNAGLRALCRPLDVDHGPGLGQLACLAGSAFPPPSKAAYKFFLDAGATNSD